MERSFFFNPLESPDPMWFSKKQQKRGRKFNYLLDPILQIPYIKGLYSKLSMPCTDLTLLLLKVDLPCTSRNLCLIQPLKQGLCVLNY
jgi:hypothetical protein